MDNSIARYAVFVKIMHGCAGKTTYKHNGMQRKPPKLEDFTSGYKSLFKDKRLLDGFLDSSLILRAAGRRREAIPVVA